MAYPGRAVRRKWYAHLSNSPTAREGRPRAPCGMGNANNSSLVRKSTELAFAAPFVVVHRLSRMAMAGTSPNARDRKEFTRMGAEKIVAFNRSWYAMWMEAARAN